MKSRMKNITTLISDPIYMEVEQIILRNNREEDQDTEDVQDTGDDEERPAVEDKRKKSTANMGPKKKALKVSNC